MTIDVSVSVNRKARRRWLLSFAFVVVFHVSAGATAMFWRPASPLLAEPTAAIMVDLAPVPTAPPEPITERPPGPEQEESLLQEESEPEPEPDPLPDPPIVEKADAVIERPPESVEELEQPQEEQIAQEMTAPPAIEAPPDDVAAAPIEGRPSLSQSTTRITWQSALLGRLERFKRYPSEAQRKAQEGVVYVRMTLDRQGNVLTRSIETSSGVQSLDAEALALIDRAQPLPPPPPEIKGDTIELVVPIEFFLKR